MKLDWTSVALGAGVGVVVGLAFKAFTTPAATPAALPAATAPTTAATTTPVPMNVTLAAGEQTVSPKVGQQVNLSLPAGGTWKSASVNGTPQTLSGSQTFAFDAPATNIDMSITWTDSTGTAQSSILHITPTS